MNTSRTALLRGLGKSALAGLLIVLLLLGALATCDSAVHGLLHPDHQSPTHYCLVTLLGNGHGEAPATFVFVPLPDGVCERSPVADAHILSSPDGLLHCGRGPPRAA